MIRQAVHAGFGYFQREAGYTRTGSHGTRVHGRETGQWHEADLAVAHWLQHTSRDGDMQLHVHSQIAHVARTATDGKWRAPDSLGYNEHIGAVAAIVSQHLEEALTRRFGLEWTARDDGHGFEIKGISGEMMRLFSSRRESITADLRARAARFEQRYGRAPSQRELAHLAQASNFTTRNPKHGALDPAQLHAGWADKLARTLGVSLASVAPSVWHGATGRAAAHAPGAEATVLPELELARAAQKAVALAQQDKSAWTRADLIKYLGRVLPRTGRDPAAAAALLQDLADRALASDFEPVACLEAPEPAEVPASLRRADGRSVYQRHGGTRYATRAQLAMEERMAAHAGADGAPRVTRAQAAHALGADPARLEDALAGRARDAGEAQDARDAQDTRTGSGLREDQAAAALAALADGRLVSVINAPAGSGKTRVLSEAARIWAEAGLGPVIGITAVPVGPQHPGRRGPGVVQRRAVPGPPARPARRPRPRPDRPGHPAGDRRGLDAVRPGPGRPDRLRPGHGGPRSSWPGTSASCRRWRTAAACPCWPPALGYARLAEPVRFRHAWEQAASLRLRDGDASVLADYDQHGRIIGGEPEQMMDAAAAAYVALTAGGTDTLLMAADHALRRELNRRIRDDLITVGIVQAGPAVTIADGTRASAGDLIICTRNDHGVEAGEPGRTLANGDLLRIEAITRRRPARPPRAGRRPGHRAAPLDRPTLRVQQLPRCRTGICGHRPRRPGPHRDRRPGRDHRHRGPPARLRRAEPRHRDQPRLRVHPLAQDRRPGPRPAPGPRARPLRPPRDRPRWPARSRRHDDASGGAHRARRRAGPRRPAALRHPDPQPGPDRHRPPGHPARDLGRRDHPRPGPALPRPAHERSTARLPQATRPPGEVAVAHPARRRTGRPGPRPRSWPTRSPNETWPDPATSLPSWTPASGTGSASLVPLPPRPWSEQVPALADPERQAYVAEIATLMDARKDRIGEHAADHPPAWATGTLGPVPAHPLDRLGWQQRAAAIGAWRELSGYDHPVDPIGPEPAAAAPDVRAAWHQALAALGPADGPDVRGMPDGRLLHLRDTYPLETAWAPQYVGDELRQVRAAAWDARLAGLRAAADARAAEQHGDHDHAAARHALAAGYQALERAYRQRETVFAQTMADRADWEHATRAQRQLAVAADAELRRRHPGQYFSPLRSAEPEPAQDQRDELILTPDQLRSEMDQWITDLAAGHRTFADQLADRQSQAIPSEDPDYGDLGPAFPAWAGPGREPILQPPKPEIPPSPHILQRVMDRDADWEAAD